MAKKLISLLCALALAIALMALPASADEDLFFLALNDTLPAASSQITPIQTGGWIYVPASVFNNRVSGVNFGVYYGFTDNNESLIFYNLSGKTLTFDLVNNTASTSTGESVMPGRPVWRGSTCYVPAYAVCSFFGLSYSFYSTDYGSLLRIKDGNARLSDSAFLSSAESLMRSRYNAAQPAPVQPSTPAQPSSPSSPNGGQSTAPASTPSNSSGGQTANRPSSSSASRPAGNSSSGSSGNSTSPIGDAAQTAQEPEPEPVKTFSLYLGLRVWGDVTPALDALAAVNATAIVFFQADQLDTYADQIRQAAGRGHRVGLVPVGDTPAQRLESVQAGSQTLARILRQETWFVLADDKELTEAGYLTWSATATVPGGSDADKYQAIYNIATARTGATRLLAGSDQPLSGLLRHFAQDGDTFLAPRETNY